MKEGARLVVGGEVDAGGGSFFRPTAFADVDNAMQIAREEIFGPVHRALLRLRRRDRQGERYALRAQATVWMSDLATAHRAAHDIRAGGVWVNTSEFLFNESPFGGMKASGFGRELSMHGMEGYTEVKNVGISIGAEGPTFEL